MATHGRSGLARLVLGSVATATLQRAGLPILLTRPTALPRPADKRVTEPTPEHVAAAVATFGPTLVMTLDRAEIDLIERGLRELMYAPESDPHLAQPVRALLTRFTDATAEWLPAVVASPPPLAETEPSMSGLVWRRRQAGRLVGGPAGCCVLPQRNAHGLTERSGRAGQSLFRQEPVGQGDREGRAAAELGLGLDPTAVRLDQRFGDVQSQAETLDSMIHLAGAIETVEDLR